MELSEVLEKLEYLPDDHIFPIEVFNQAEEMKEIITPALLTELDLFCENYKDIRNDMDYTRPIFSMFLLAKFRNKEAFPLILKAFSLEPNFVSDYFSDIITEDFNRLLLSTYNGNLLSLVNFIKNDKLEEWSRISVSKTLVTLVVHSIEPREKVLSLQERLLEILNPETDMPAVIECLLRDIITLSPEGEFREKVKLEIESNEHDSFMGLEKSYDQMLVNEEGSAINTLRNNVHHSFIDDLEKDLGWWSWFSTRKEIDNEDTFFMEDEYEDTPPYPIVSEGKIGRNAPMSL